MSVLINPHRFGVGAEVAIIGSGFVKQPTNATSWQISSFSLAAGSNRGLFVAVGAHTSANVLAVTLNPGGLALTKLGEARGGGFALSTMWGVVGGLPGAGTYTIDISIDSNDGMAYAIAVENVRQTLPTCFTGVATSATTVSTTLTGTWDAGDIVFGGYQSGDGNLSVTFSVTGAIASAVETYNPTSDASGAATAEFSSGQTNPTATFTAGSVQNRQGMTAVVLEAP